MIKQALATSIAIFDHRSRPIVGLEMKRAVNHKLRPISVFEGSVALQLRGRA
jgi:hypothetical protein